MRPLRQYPATESHAGCRAPGRTGRCRALRRHLPEVVRLAGLDARQDAQLRKHVPATCDVCGITGDVKRRSAGPAADLQCDADRSPAAQSVKSTCSVNATAGIPRWIAERHSCSIVDVSAVSHDHREWTWLSAGSISSGVPRSECGRTAHPSRQPARKRRTAVAPSP